MPETPKVGVDSDHGGNIDGARVDGGNADGSTENPRYPGRKFQQQQIFLDMGDSDSKSHRGSTQKI